MTVPYLRPGRYVLWIGILATSTLAAQSTDRPGPRFSYLRFEDDFSYLDGPPGSYRADTFDAIKRIHLRRDLTLRLGGELRLRYEAELNKFLSTGTQEVDGFLLSRTAVHGDLQYRGVTRLFVEGVHAEVADRDEFLFFIHRNRHDLHQLFADLRPLATLPITLRVGRQEMAYRTQRVISASGWGRVRKRFDAVKMLLHRGAWRVDAWYARPVTTLMTAFDRREDSLSFYGAFVQYDGLRNHDVDFYALALRDRRTRESPNGQAGARTTTTLGVRLAGGTGAVDYELELTAQPGSRWAGDPVRAWSAGGTIGYTARGPRAAPRAALRFELATGDPDATDTSVGTFDQLFRQEKDFLGYLALFGRQNIGTVNATVGAWLVPRAVKLDVFYYPFWLLSDADAIYNPGGMPIPGRRDPTGQSGRWIGQEVDVTIGWRADAHQSLLIGYSRFWNGEFLRATGGGRDPMGFYLQYQMLF